MAGQAEPELRLLHNISPCHGLAVDAGANEGHYSYSLSKLHEKVFAFEPDRALTVALAAWNPGNVEIVNAGLSDCEGEGVLYVPVSSGTILSGWGSLRPGNCPGVGTHIEKRIRLLTLDSFRLENVSFIKVDVEGFELEVLKGAADTIARCRPVVMAELKVSNEREVCAFLSTFHYAVKRLDDLTGDEGTLRNFIFLPLQT